MVTARNRVIAGDYLDCSVSKLFGYPYIRVSIDNPIVLSLVNVERYELIKDEHRKSAGSAIYRGLIGAALFGPAGATVGALAAENIDINHVAIYFKDGKKSLLEVNDKIYNAIIKYCF